MLTRRQMSITTAKKQKSTLPTNKHSSHVYVKIFSCLTIHLPPPEKRVQHDKKKNYPISWEASTPAWRSKQTFPIFPCQFSSANNITDSIFLLFFRFRSMQNMKRRQKVNPYTGNTIESFYYQREPTLNQ